MSPQYESPFRFASQKDASLGGDFMPRINIEDSIYRDPRYQEYMLRCGSRREAIGGWVEVLMAGQKYFLSHGEIPIEKFYALGLDERLIETGLVKKTPTGVVIIGQAEHFAWLKKRSEAGHKGGVASAEAREAKYGSSQPKVEAMLEIPEANSSNPKQKQASSSFSYSKKKEYIRASGDAPEQSLFEIWNSNRGNLPEAKALSKKRSAASKLRWLEHPSQEYWVSVVARAAASDFCNGHGTTGWRADFDWIIKPDTHLRILEGKYDNKKPATAEKLVFKEPKKFGEK